MIAVLKHELSGYFHSLTAYIFGAFLMAFVGIGAMIYNIQQSVANFEYVLSFVSLAFVVLVPILTMRVIAEERKQKTDQLLYSLDTTRERLKSYQPSAVGLDYILNTFNPLLEVFGISEDMVRKFSVTNPARMLTQ